MAEFLFITPLQLTQNTIISGNIDIDKYIYCVAEAQISVIEPMLGTELYDVILAGAEADTLTGLYATLYTEFVKPITKLMAASKYIHQSPYTLDNGGFYKHTSANSETVPKEEVEMISNDYASFAQMYVQRFEKWICKNTISEFKRSQDEVNAQNIKLNSGWYFGSGVGKDEDDLWD